MIALLLSFIGLSRLGFSAWRRWILIVGPCLCLSCGDGTGPVSPQAAPGLGATDPSTNRLEGLVVGTTSDRPVGGARVTLSGASVTTGADGRFSVAVSSSTGVIEASVRADGHVTRRLFVRPSDTEVRLDVIETGGLWNLEFYRELARNGAGGGSLLALNPWTVEPSFYIDRRPEAGQNRAIPDGAVAAVELAIHTVVPLLTLGRFSGSEIEIGMEPPPDQTAGAVVIRWNPVEVAEVAGAAAAFTRGVGGNSSVVVIRTLEDTEAIFHELGHVLGLYHPLSSLRPSHMFGAGTPARPYFTDWDVFHANITYRRPPGNEDIDEDPPGFVINDRTLGSGRGAEPTLVACPAAMAGARSEH